MKAILVIDLPKNCSECKLMFLQGIGEGICNAVDWEERPSWCPLKPLPDCPDVPDTIANDVAYIIGWNDCIVEISKERKEAKTLIRNDGESVSNANGTSIK